MKQPVTALECCYLFAALRGIEPGTLAFEGLAHERLKFWACVDGAWSRAWLRAVAESHMAAPAMVGVPW